MHMGSPPGCTSNMPECSQCTTVKEPYRPVPRRCARPRGPLCTRCTTVHDRGAPPNNRSVPGAHWSVAVVHHQGTLHGDRVLCCVPSRKRESRPTDAVHGTWPQKACTPQEAQQHIVLVWEFHTKKLHGINDHYLELICNITDEGIDLLQQAVNAKFTARLRKQVQAGATVRPPLRRGCSDSTIVLLQMHTWMSKKYIQKAKEGSTRLHFNKKSKQTCTQHK